LTGIPLTPEGGFGIETPQVLKLNEATGVMFGTLEQAETSTFTVEFLSTKMTTRPRTRNTAAATPSITAPIATDRQGQPAY
jgi:hypothetical protein